MAGPSQRGSLPAIERALVEALARAIVRELRADPGIARQGAPLASEYRGTSVATARSRQRTSRRIIFPLAGAASHDGLDEDEP